MGSIGAVIIVESWLFKFWPGLKSVNLRYLSRVNGRILERAEIQTPNFSDNHLSNVTSAQILPREPQDQH